jgi:hypothetical protein
VHATLLSPLFTPVGPLAAESKFQHAVSPSLGSVEAETSLEVEAGVGRGRDSSRDRGRGRVRGSGEAETSSRGRSLRSGKAELPVAPEAELDG